MAETKRDVAEQTNQLVVNSYHRIEHGENNVPMNKFREVVDHVKKKDMDVITPSQFIDGGELVIHDESDSR